MANIVKAPFELAFGIKSFLINKIQQKFVPIFVTRDLRFNKHFIILRFVVGKSW